MKTAVIFTGHMRSFERCLPTQHWQIFRHLDAPDLFVSTIADADAPKAELLRARYPSARVEIDILSEQPDCIAEMRAKGVALPAEWHPGRPYTHEPYPISVHPQAVLRQLWQLSHAWEKWDFSGYDFIIRTRPDLWFHSGLPFGFRCDLSLVPFWGSFGGINDRFAILSKWAAKQYFTTYGRIHDLTLAGCPLHPESLLGASMDQWELFPLNILFSTLRTTGEFRAPEVSGLDLASLPR